MAGICSCGGYIPRYRLDRKLIFGAMGWMNAAGAGLARGTKAVANFDEDTLTMAVAAGTNALAGKDCSSVSGVYLASTTLPYRERLNAGIVTTALGLNEHIRAADFCCGVKAGTTALLAALDNANADKTAQVLVCAADCKLGKPASPQELIFGDAAASLLVGQDNVIAQFKGSYSTTYDFVDHFRGNSTVFDQQWEDRWIREQGVTTFIPEAINGLLDKYGLTMKDFSKVVYPCHYAAARKKINKILGITEEMEQRNLQAEAGESGAAHALVMFVSALEAARPGDRILLVGCGGGCDALYFEVTPEIENYKSHNTMAGYLASGVNLDNYTKYLTWRGILDGDVGLRGEETLPTRWSTLWRKRKEITGLCGSKCLECGTAQYPPQRICVNPDCGAVDTMDDYRFADKIGHIASYTGDMLAACANPPAIYGQIEFEGGGKYMFDLTDCDLDDLQTGQAVAMSFRKKYYDKQRAISGYFWKAVPVKEEK